jgi:LysM repeat protein
MSVLSRALMLSAAAVLAACATAQENPHYKYSTKYKGDAPNSAYASNTASQHGAATHATVQSASYQSTASSAPLSYTRNAPQTGTANSITVHNAGVQSAPALHSASGQTLSSHISSGQILTDQAVSAHSAVTQSAAYQVPLQNTGSGGAPVYSRISATCVTTGQQGTLDCTPQSISIGTQTAQITRPYKTLQITGAETIIAANTSGQNTSSYAAAQYTAVSSTGQDIQGTPGYEAMKNVETGISEEAAPARAEVVNARAMDLQSSQQNTFALGRSHVVRKGDTVYSFSRQLCSSIEDIKNMNGLDASFGLKIGQTIRLPASNC